jgi:hypothetical protein
LDVKVNDQDNGQIYALESRYRFFHLHDLTPPGCVMQLGNYASSGNGVEEDQRDEEEECGESFSEEEASE